LVIESALVRSNLKQFFIFGNPVCEPKTIRYISHVYPNSDRILSSENEAFIPWDADETQFLSALVPSGASLKSVTVVDLRRQCISSLAPLSGLPELVTLFASGTGLTVVDFSSPTLEFADLSDNAISEFPDENQFPKLLTLLANRNQLKAFAPFGTLSALFVGDNLIEALPSAELLPNLDVLYVLGNPCAKAYPDSRFIFALTRLRMLDGNVITPQMRTKAERQWSGVLFVEDLSKLIEPHQTTLYLPGRELRVVNALCCERLIELDLSNNAITSIDWPPNALPRLVSLNLSGNQLQLLDFLPFLGKLKILGLSANELNDGHLIALSNMRLTSLVELILTKNLIKRIDLIPHQNFPNLERFIMCRNYLSTVSKGAFDCRELKVLDLSYNLLRKLDHIGVPSLVALDVSHNRIVTVDEVEKLHCCTQLLKFAFNDNPLTQRISPRIRCLCILRSLTEMDGRIVTENDLAQVRILLDQNDGMPPPSTMGRATKVNTVILQPGLPQLAQTVSRRKPGR
jgi:Leucine-rich repeat (LRR) protein